MGPVLTYKDGLYMASAQHITIFIPQSLVKSFRRKFFQTSVPGSKWHELITEWYNDQTRDNKKLCKIVGIPQEPDNYFPDPEYPE